MSHRCEYCDTAHNQMPGWSHVVKPNGSHLWWCRVQEGMWTFAIGVRVVVDERGPLITWIARPERGEGNAREIGMRWEDAHARTVPRSSHVISGRPRYPCSQTNHAKSVVPPPTFSPAAITAPGGMDGRGTSR